MLSNLVLLLLLCSSIFIFIFIQIFFYMSDKKSIENAETFENPVVTISVNDAKLTSVDDDKPTYVDPTEAPNITEGSNTTEAPNTTEGSNTTEAPITTYVATPTYNILSTYNNTNTIQQTTGIAATAAANTISADKAVAAAAVTTATTAAAAASDPLLFAEDYIKYNAYNYDTLATLRAQPFYVNWSPDYRTMASGIIEIRDIVRNYDKGRSSFETRTAEQWNYRQTQFRAESQTYLKFMKKAVGTSSNITKYNNFANLLWAVCIAERKGLNDISKMDNVVQYMNSVFKDLPENKDIYDDMVLLVTYIKRYHTL